MIQGRIVEMNAKNVSDINAANQPFEVIGRLVPSFYDGAWSFSERLYQKAYHKSYPNDEEHYADYIGHPEKIVYFYYDGKACAGQIRLRKNWNRYAFIEDIAVAAFHRGRGVGSKLIEKAREWAQAKGLLGFMLETQDVNLLACRFYHKLGFKIGGVDTMLYANFDNANERAVFWYQKF